MPLLRWSAQAWRKVEAARDRIMFKAGTKDPWYMEEFSGEGGVAVHWRKPLRIDEVNRLAPTPEVKARAGRP